MATTDGITVRVYGLVINPQQEILLANEFWFGQPMTKFPGGGLIPGEGVLDCLRREFQEELDMAPTRTTHFYTTDFYQPTALITPPRQLISIYYLTELENYAAVKVVPETYQQSMVEGAMAFYWKPLISLTPEHLTFPIDKKVTALLLAQITR